MPRLVSARWLANHGVSLGYLGGPSRFVRPDGALTVGEAARLLGILPLTVYRLADRGVLHFGTRRGVATMGLNQLRRYQANGKARS